MKPLFLSGLLLLSSSLFSQPFTATEIQTRVNSLAEERPGEAVYLHLDKAIYLSGEDLWYAVYLVDHRTLLPSPLSGLVYVDLIDEQNAILSTQRIPIVSGKGQGQLRLSHDLTSGLYRLRAYTHWMRNERRDFQSTFQLLNPQDGAAISWARMPAYGTQPDVQFLPEGGHLVAGLEQVVAVKALGTNGLGVDLQGRILDGNEQVVTTFSTVHRGMGRFSFQSRAGEQYQAEIEWQGKSLRYALPKVESRGVSLRVDPGRLINEVEIQASPDLVGTHFFLLGQVRGQICLLAKFSLEQPVRQFSLSTYKIPPGVMQLTLLTESGQALAERLVFVRPNQASQLQAQLDQTRFGTRAPLNLQLMLKQAQSEAKGAQLSVAVVEANTCWLDRPDRSSIQSHFWLQNDLQGFIEDPAFYMELDNPAVDQALDLLLLTQGWRKWDWNAVWEDRLPIPRFYIEKGLTLSGTVRNPGGKRVAKSPVVLLAGDLFLSYGTETDDQGRFVLGELSYTDTTELVFQARSPKNRVRAYRIELDSAADYPVQPAPSYVFHQAADREGMASEAWFEQAQAQVSNRDLEAGEYAFDLEEVSISAKQSDRDQQAPEGAVYHRASQTLLADELAPFFNIFEALRGRVPGLQITGSPRNYSVLIRGVNSILLSSEPLYLVDGIPTDQELIQSIPMSEIKRVDVLKGSDAAAFGIRGASGVIAVYTKDGADRSEEDDRREGILRTRLPGYSIVREFYAPRYDAGSIAQSMPDLRTTIYWNPLVEVGAAGNVELDFYHSDVKGEFLVIVEGMTSEGEPIRATTSYRVD